MKRSKEQSILETIEQIEKVGIVELRNLEMFTKKVTKKFTKVRNVDVSVFVRQGFEK